MLGRATETGDKSNDSDDDDAYILYLDSGCTFISIKDRGLLTDIRRLPSAKICEGQYASGKLEYSAHMRDFGEVMYDKRGTANLIGQAVLEDRGELTRDANYGPYRWRKHGGTREYVFRRVGKLYECRITRDDVMLGPTLHFRPSERAQLMRPVVAQCEVFTAQQVK